YLTRTPLYTLPSPAQALTLSLHDALPISKTNIGLAAPIGVSINFNKNFTVFASIIDLGTLVNVRLNNDTTFFSNLKFEHFLAPRSEEHTSELQSRQKLVCRHLLETHNNPS